MRIAEFSLSPDQKTFAYAGDEVELSVRSSCRLLRLRLRKLEERVGGSITFFSDALLLTAEFGGVVS